MFHLLAHRFDKIVNSLYIEIKIMLSGFKFSRIKSGTFDFILSYLLILSYLILSYSIYIFHFRGLDLSVMNKESRLILRRIFSTGAWLENISYSWARIMPSDNDDLSDY